MRPTTSASPASSSSSTAPTSAPRTRAPPTPSPGTPRRPANGQHTLTAIARDAAGNTTTRRASPSPSRNRQPVTRRRRPSQLTERPPRAPPSPAPVSVTANASDNVGVAGVQFKLDGANLGAEDTSAPYSVAWDTTSAANGQHTLTAIARDAAGNRTTREQVTVTVNNVASQPPTSSTLRWPAPELTSPQTILIPERGGESGILEAGKDYIVCSSQTGRRYGPLRLLRADATSSSSVGSTSSTTRPRPTTGSAASRIPRPDGDDPHRGVPRPGPGADRGDQHLGAERDPPDPEEPDREPPSNATLTAAQIIRT